MFQLKADSSLLLVAVAAAATLACSGTDDQDRPELVSSDADSEGILDPFDCEAVMAAHEFFEVESFERDDNNAANGTTLNWWVNDDGTNPNRFPVPPDPNAEIITGNLVNISEGGAPNPRADCLRSEKALNLISEPPGFTGWGYVFGATFNSPVLSAPEDNGFDGLGFWARRGNGTEPQTMKASITDPKTSAPQDPNEEAYCRDGLVVMELCDPFGKAVGLETEWRFFKLPFEELRQEGYGQPVPEGLDLQNLIGLNYSIGAGTWSVWVDEFVYYTDVND